MQNLRANRLERACIVCGSNGAKRPFVAREVLHGTLEEFDYFECLDCGSLQIAEIPPDLSKYYPSDYYSLAPVPRRVEPLSWPRAFLRGQRTNYYIDRSRRLGRIIDKFAPNYFDLPWEWFSHSRLSVNSRILDVGCGSGALLWSLHDQGFRHLTGIDPHIDKSVTAPGLRILKGEVGDLTGQFDFIMSHHSLEHMPDPIAALRHMRRALRPRGHFLVRLPIAGTYAWKRYGVNWAGLDPPRHIFAPTVAGMKKLIERGGFEIKTYWFDSNESTLLLSEKHERGFPGHDRETGSTNAAGFLTKKEIADVRRRAAELKAAGEGDTACFILQISASEDSEDGRQRQAT